MKITTMMFLGVLKPRHENMSLVLKLELESNEKRKKKIAMQLFYWNRGIGLCQKETNHDTNTSVLQLAEII